MANHRLQTIPPGSGTPAPIDSENETLDFQSVRVGADKLELSQVGSGVSAKMTTNGVPIVVPPGSAPDEPATIQQVNDIVGGAAGSFTASEGIQRIGDDFSLVDLGIETIKYADDSVTKEKINADVAGYGLGQNVDGSLEVNEGSGITLIGDDVAVLPDPTGGANLATAIDVNSNGVAVKVDDVTIEGNPSNGRLRVKNLGVDTAHLAANAVTTEKITDENVTVDKLATDSVSTVKIQNEAITKEKINDDVAGAGLRRGVGGELELSLGNGVEVDTDLLKVKPDVTAGANLAAAIDVNSNGVAVKVDDATIEGNLSGQLRVVAKSIGTGQLTDDSVTKEIINADVAGAGLVQAVDGSFEVNAGDGIDVSSDQVKVNPRAAAGTNIAPSIDVSTEGVGIKIDDSSIGVNLSAQLQVKANGIATAMLQNDSVTKDKINEDVAGSGIGIDLDGSLKLNQGDGLEIVTDVLRAKRLETPTATVANAINVSADGLGVRVDGTSVTVDAATGRLKIVAGGVTGTEIADDSIAANHLNPDTAGAGLGQDVDGALEVNPGDGIEISGDTVAAKARAAAGVNIANSVDVSSDGLGVLVDEVTVEPDPVSGQLRVKDGGITEDKLGALSVATGKIQDEAVTTGKIGNLQVTAGKLAANAVETTKILDDAVTKEKVAADVAGAGIGQNLDGSLEVNAGDGIEIVVDNVQVKKRGAIDGYKANSIDVDSVGVGILVDTTTIEADPSTGRLRVVAQGIGTAQIEDSAVTRDKIAGDVAGAGLGKDVDGALEVLPGDGIEIDTDLVKVKPRAAAGTNIGHSIDVSSDGLGVLVDESTVEADPTTGQLRVVASGITANELAADSVTPSKLHASVAGAGLAQNGGDDSLEVTPGNGIEISGDAVAAKARAAAGTNIAHSIDVSSDGLGVLVDESTIEADPTTGQLRVVASGITANELAAGSVTKEKVNADVAGAGIGQNVDGSLEVNPGAGIQVVSDAVAAKRRTSNTTNVAHAVDVDPTEGLGVRVDDVTLEGDPTTGRLRIKAVGTSQVVDDSITKEKINADVAGAGIGQNVDGSLEVNVGNGLQVATDEVSVVRDATGGANLAKAIDVNANGVAVRVDGATIEGDDTTGRLRVVEEGIGTAQLGSKVVTTAKIGDGAVDTLQLAAEAVEAAKIAPDAVTKEKINADIAGIGLAQNVDGSLEVSPGNGIQLSGDTVAAKADVTGGANLAKAIDVNANGIAVKVDDATIEGDATTGRLKVKDGGITNTKLGADAVNADKIADNAIQAEHINTSAVGTGLTGGGGSPLALDFTQVVNYSDADFVVGVGGQTQFDVGPLDITASNRIDFFRNGQLLIEGASNDYQRDAANDRVTTNYTIPQGSRVKVRVYLG